MEQYTTVIGLDLGDKESTFAVMNYNSTSIQFEGKVATTRKDFERCFVKYEASTIVMEVGTHSPWVSRLLNELGHEVIVANARRLRMIYGNARKSDKVDAQTLARVARLDRTLLYPIAHRGEAARWLRQSASGSIAVFSMVEGTLASRRDSSTWSSRSPDASGRVRHWANPPTLSTQQPGTLKVGLPGMSTYLPREMYG